MTSFAAAELRALQRLRERSDAEAPSSSLCARQELFKCSAAALICAFAHARRRDEAKIRESAGLPAPERVQRRTFRPVLDSHKVRDMAASSDVGIGGW